MQGFKLSLYTDKGYSISVLIIQGCWIGLCVSLQKNVMLNDVVRFGGLDFFS
jgi:hypothetical protein